MAKKLTEWFRDAIEMKAQTIDFILPHMALSFVDPRHKDALKQSCHGQAARALSHGYDQGHVNPDDKIKMFGTDKTGLLLHTIITDKDNNVRFDSLHEELGSYYDRAQDTYVCDQWDAKVRVIKELSFAEFQRDYVSRVTVSRSPPAAAPTPPAS